MTAQFTGRGNGRVTDPIAIIGPPGSGKSTLLDALAQRTAVASFKLSAEATRLVVAPDPLDELGWLSEEAAEQILRRRLPELLSTDAQIAFENFPGSAVQATLLTQSLAECAHGLVVAELSANPDELSRRVGERLVCDHCGRLVGLGCPCGGRGIRRREDGPAVFAARLRRYRQRRDAVVSTLTEAGATILQIDAARRVDEVAEQVLAVATGRMNESLS